MPDLVNVMPGSLEWRAARRLGVTATDIVTVLGLSRWDSAYALYWRKTGVTPEVDAWPEAYRLKTLVHQLRKWVSWSPEWRH
jgi:predicted phage-related endonuclease